MVYKFDKIMQYFIETETRKVVLDSDEDGKNQAKFFIYKELKDDQIQRSKLPKIKISLEILSKVEAAKMKAG